MGVQILLSSVVAFVYGAILAATLRSGGVKNDFAWIITAVFIFMTPVAAACGAIMWIWGF